jgi:hypothetical protein
MNKMSSKSGFKGRYLDFHWIDIFELLDHQNQVLYLGIKGLFVGMPYNTLI